MNRPMKTSPAAKTVRGKAAPKARILLVDDDERNLLALSEVLEGLAEVVTATSGPDALRQLLKGDFAVILLDVFMPGMDGYETAQLIRQREQTARIPIIFLSAVNKETEHLMRGYAMGAVDYVFKPVDPLILQSKVGVFVDLYDMRMQVEEKSRSEQALLDAALKANGEKLLAERELRLVEQRQAAIVTSLPLVLYLEPLEHRPRRPSFVSGNLASVTGYGLDEVHAAEDFWESRLHPEDRDRVLAALDHRHEAGGWSIHYRWQCADGSFRHFHDQAVLLSGRDGSPSEFAGSLADISERKELENQLVQVQKMDAIGQLTGGIAHDFNNLLASVLGGLHLLQRRLDLGERDQLIVDQMRHAAEQGAELVRRMMAFARKQDLTPASVDSGVLCKSVAGLVESTLGGTVTIDWHCPKSTRYLYVDQSQLELALVNLILNARDAMPGGGEVGVAIDEVSDGGESFVRIRVSDQGEGIPPELIDKITEPFFTTKEAGKGTGLGLSMVMGFVQQSGGRFHVDSEHGRGTTIELWLPSTSSAPAPQRVTVDLHDGEVDCYSVLLVDDDDAVRTVIGEQLRDLGMTVEAVASGDQAIGRLETDGADFDLLLTDFAMPGMNGIETINVARKQRPDLRVVLMTGYADDQAIAGVRGNVEVLRKPIKVADLKRALAG
ncbi:MAG TPA: response regulator [Sphingomicrobium sp.]|nr:response regulator [Sphingomicrobium sp.]